MKKQFLAGLFAAAMMAPATALAQDSNETETFIGVSAGYHYLGVGSGETEGVELYDRRPILRVVQGVDWPVDGNMFAGFEDNFHFETDVIDYEYGALARFDIHDSSGTKYYLRGG
ncbi:MAG: hypothetical protein O3C52_08485 [Proteobacteria bacterium]|nr:hypothetical protein [Pseudomonadota bacterium]MDA0914007.1 hypothetical protein [Pseudomonadota bacterium]MDA1033382.1 hypothetical protein [Pseudomonadota bacterium]